MAHLGQTFDSSTLPESKYNPIPAGTYNAVIASAELKNTKTGTGQYINIMMTITGPTQQGRVVFSKINIVNANPTAEEIGRAQLADLIKAIGVHRLSDTDQLVGGNLSIQVTLKTSDEYGEQNDVKKFKPLSGAAPVAASKFGAVSKPVTTAPAKTSSGPWKKTVSQAPVEAAQQNDVPF